MIPTGDPVLATAIMAGVLAFLVTLGASFLPGPKVSRSKRVLDSLFWGLLFGTGRLVGALLGPASDHEGGPPSTLFVVVVCLAAITGAVLFFRAMLRDGSLED